MPYHDELRHTSYQFENIKFSLILKRFGIMHDAKNYLDAFWRAIDLYYNNKPAFAKAVHNGMTADFSWKKPAGEYMALYRKLTNND